MTIGNDNNSLQSLQGLNTLETISYGSLNIGGDDLNITNFEGLNNLKSIAIRFRVSGNDSLVNFAGLENLENIGFEFNISYNPLLQNFSGLQNLSSISHLYIEECPQLVDLSGLESIVNMNNTSIRIGNCDNFESLNGIQNIDYSTIEYIKLQYIDSLSDCSLPNVCTYLYNNGVAYITQNAPGCNSIQDILDHCAPLAINDENQMLEIEIFPNPTGDIFEIQTKINIKKIIVYSTLGSKIKEFEKADAYNISDLNQGIYIVEIKTVKGSKFTKILKN